MPACSARRKVAAGAPVVELDQDEPVVRKRSKSFGFAASSSSLTELAASYVLAEIPARATPSLDSDTCP